jgi:hypothetical protein
MPRRARVGGRLFSLLLALLLELLIVLVPSSAGRPTLIFGCEDLTIGGNSVTAKDISIAHGDSHINQPLAARNVFWRSYAGYRDFFSGFSRCQALPIGVGSAYLCRFIGRNPIVAWASSPAARNRNVFRYSVPNIPNFIQDSYVEAFIRDYLSLRRNLFDHEVSGLGIFRISELSNYQGQLLKGGEGVGSSDTHRDNFKNCFSQWRLVGTTMASFTIDVLGVASGQEWSEGLLGAVRVHDRSFLLVLQH